MPQSPPEFTPIPPGSSLGYADASQQANAATLPSGVTPTPAGGSTPVNTPANITPVATELGKDFLAVSPLSPELTSQFFGWLQSVIGKGATPYSGQLSADKNALLQQIVSMLSGGSSTIPGADALKQFTESGLPIDVMPAWDAMKAAAQRSIDQGAARLQGQFAFTGNLAGSPFGTAMSDYQSQTAKDLNAQLEMMMANALENARGRQLSASQFTTGMASDVSKYTQGLDQSALDRMYAEFMRTQPEYNPLLSTLYGASTTFPPTLHPQQGLGILGALLGNAGNIGKILSDASGGKIDISKIPDILKKIPDIFKGGTKTGTGEPGSNPTGTPTGLPGHEGWIQASNGMWMSPDQWAANNWTDPGTGAINWDAFYSWAGSGGYGEGTGSNPVDTSSFINPDGSINWDSLYGYDTGGNGSGDTMDWTSFMNDLWGAGNWGGGGGSSGGSSGGGGGSESGDGGGTGFDDSDWWWSFFG